MSDKFQVKRNLGKLFDDAVCEDQNAGELYQDIKKLKQALCLAI